MTPNLATGSRHYTEAPATAALWHCPACDFENSGPLEQGCVSCGSGKPGMRAPMVAVTPIEVPAGPHEVPLSPIEAAFIAWRKQTDLPKDDVDSDQNRAVQIYTAFVAGYHAALGRVQNEVTQPLPGTAESRTIVAALRLFRDQVLSETPEEAISGEWLTARDVDLLIARLERTA